jgi:hypothetical protein
LAWWGGSSSPTQIVKSVKGGLNLAYFKQMLIRVMEFIATTFTSIRAFRGYMSKYFTK